jgi:hypothetical protein
VVVKSLGQSGNPNFYKRFLNLCFNNYRPSLSRGRKSLRRIWVNAMWDVRRSAGCTAWRKSTDVRRGGGARRRARRRSRDARCGTKRGRGVGRRGYETRHGTRAWSGTRGVVFRRISEVGLKGKKDVSRCPYTLHSWTHSRRKKRGQGKSCKRDERKYPPTFHRWVPSSHQGSWERRFESRKRLKNIGSCSSLNRWKETSGSENPLGKDASLRVP